MLQRTLSSPATQTSLTGTETFSARLLHSERWRIVLMIAALSLVLFTTLFRRALGGLVMSSDAVFYRAVAVLVAALAYQAIALCVVRIRARRGGAIPTWQRTLSVIIDLAVPGALLLISQLYSPRGAYTALSAPPLLLIPLITLLSILRLRPWFSLATGLGGALMHIALVIHARRIADIDPELQPVLFTYGAMLALTGAAAAVVSWKARHYVIEAVSEATTAEQAQREVALVEQDLRVARDIQMGLLPSTEPELNGFAVAGMSRPAAHAGGDYYDWQPLPDGRLVVVIADVSGHGVGPALVTAVCRAYARASAPTSTAPEALMERINELICHDIKGERFITMVIAVVNESGEVELVSAGHGPTLLFHQATNKVEWFGGDGLPLGLVNNESYAPRRTLQMDSGDVLVLLTDGFFERSRPGDEEQFGVERLTSILQKCAAQSPAQIIAAIDQAVTEYAAGSPQSDDMTAVAIKRN